MKSKALIAKESRNRKRLKGLCRDCGKPLDRLDRSRCLSCLRKNQAAMEKVQAERIRQGLCPNHGIKATDGYENCFKCTAAHRQKVYGLSIIDFDQKVKEQNNCCAICGTEFLGVGHKTNAPRVDHDHKTGQVRKLLCGLCNTGLGKFKDDEALLQKASDYLKNFK